MSDTDRLQAKPGAPIELHPTPMPTGGRQVIPASRFAVAAIDLARAVEVRGIVDVSRATVSVH